MKIGERDKEVKIVPKVFLTIRHRREDAFRSAIKAYIFEENTTKKELAEKANIPTRTLFKRLEAPGSMTLDELWSILDSAHVPEERRQKILN
ncbi:hypothetical protein [Blautia producta]|uniref:hypothetical protein n=1 Tax=Blautia producta TaxID=33035 RepID=UPI001023BB2F|nr:hypothetical protein [Blautia producta]